MLAYPVPNTVSTHSRPKAAGLPLRRRIAQIRVSTHSRPKAAGTKQTALSWAWMFQHTAARRRLEPHGFFGRAMIDVSTHSRPKAAGNFMSDLGFTAEVSTHSRPKAAGRTYLDDMLVFLFQHTAARRRLVPNPKDNISISWFQHTAARRRLVGRNGDLLFTICFNTQPPEGGWRRNYGTGFRTA